MCWFYRPYSPVWSHFSPNLTCCCYILFITFYHHLWRFSMYTIPLSLIRSEQKQSKSAKPKLQKFRKKTSKSLTIPFEMPGCGRPASSWYPKNKASQSLGKVAMVLATTSSALGSIARTSSSRIMPHFALARWGWLEQGGKSNGRPYCGHSLFVEKIRNHDVHGQLI